MVWSECEWMDKSPAMNGLKLMTRELWTRQDLRLVVGIDLVDGESCLDEKSDMILSSLKKTKRLLLTN